MENLFANSYDPKWAQNYFLRLPYLAHNEPFSMGKERFSLMFIDL
jgi:hypothetical protein